MNITPSDVMECMRRRSMTLDQLVDTAGIDNMWQFGQWIDGTLLEPPEDWEARLIGVGVISGMTGPPIGADPVTEPEQPAAPQLVSSLITPATSGGDHPAVEAPATPSADERPLGPLVAGARQISNSEVLTFKRCRRKWWLAWHRGLVAGEIPVGVKHTGQRIHRALEVGYAPGGPYPERILDALELVIAADRQLLLDGLPEGNLEADELRLQFEKDADLERIMLSGYVEWLAETGADSNLTVIGAEEKVVAPLVVSGERVVLIIGRLDVRVQRKSDGAILFIDHKTVGNFSGVEVTLPMNEQTRHYQLLQWLTAPEDQRVAGAIFNMMRRVKRTARATPPFYRRVDVLHNRHVMNEYYTRLITEIEQMLEVEEKVRNGDLSVVYPTPNRDCTWDCPFVKVCPMFDDGSRVEDAITAQFTVADPLAYYDRRSEEEGSNT